MGTEILDAKLIINRRGLAQTTDVDGCYLPEEDAEAAVSSAFFCYCDWK
jgi:hypothetical protein